MSLLDTIGLSLAVFGSLLCLLGATGLLRFPDLYTRMHAAGVIDTLGAFFVLLGLILYFGVSSETARLLLILAFLWIASPTACHALAQSAMAAGEKPWVKGGPDESADPGEPSRSGEARP
jgi:multicomponent Na+:H+ antiporter subunit G